MSNFPNDTFSLYSKNILNEVYNKNYMNVYNKGAVLSFLLDLKIRQATNNKTSLKEIAFILKEKYQDSYFNDDSLFMEIVSLSDSSIESFITKYIQNNDTLPYEEYLSLLGWRYLKENNVEVEYFGNLSLEFEKGENLVVSNGDKKTNRFGLKKGDIILFINDIPVTGDNYFSLTKYIYSPEENKKVTIKYLRKNNEIFTWATPANIEINKKHYLEIKTKFTREEEEFRDDFFRF
jgi:predicted metalloprotease with PDZ domain